MLQLCRPTNIKEPWYFILTGFHGIAPRGKNENLWMLKLFWPPPLFGGLKLFLAPFIGVSKFCCCCCCFFSFKTFLTPPPYFPAPPPHQGIYKCSFINQAWQCNFSIFWIAFTAILSFSVLCCRVYSNLENLKITCITKWQQYTEWCMFDWIKNVIACWKF